MMFVNTKSLCQYLLVKIPLLTIFPFVFTEGNASFMSLTPNWDSKAARGYLVYHKIHTGNKLKATHPGRSELLSVRFKRNELCDLICRKVFW